MLTKEHQLLTHQAIEMKALGDRSVVEAKESRLVSERLNDKIRE